MSSAKFCGPYYPLPFLLNQLDVGFLSLGTEKTLRVFSFRNETISLKEVRAAASLTSPKR